MRCVIARPPEKKRARVNLRESNLSRATPPVVESRLAERHRTFSPRPRQRFARRRRHSPARATDVAATDPRRPRGRDARVESIPDRVPRRARTRCARSSDDASGRSRGRPPRHLIRWGNSDLAGTDGRFVRSFVRSRFAVRGSRWIAMDRDAFRASRVLTASPSSRRRKPSDRSLEIRNDF